MSSQVIERLKEQLAKAGKERGFRKPIYKTNEDGTQSLKTYARQHITVVCQDILDLVKLIPNKEDEIVKAQTKGHTFGVTCPPARDGDQPKATMYADDLFHLIELAEVGAALQPEKVNG